MKALGERIRELREAKDLSLRELATRLGLSAAFLSDVELGRRNPSKKVWASMAKVLDSTLEDLRTYDQRAPLEELKRLASRDPSFGLAFRRIVDKQVSPEDLIRLAERKPDRSKK
jgi:transcriptional regulator with XRE-family HTH domain